MEVGAHAIYIAEDTTLKYYDFNVMKIEIKILNLCTYTKRTQTFIPNNNSCILRYFFFKHS